MRILVPFHRHILSVRALLLLSGVLWCATTGWSQAADELENLRARATQGDAEAQNALGNAYTNGQLGLPPDFAEALKWYRLAGDKKFAAAQFNLGLVSELGRGCVKDEAQTFKYYLLAAEQGYAPAQFNVGNMYSAGRGVGQDFFEANLWFKQAADNGLVEAQFNLALAHESGRGLKKDEAQAARWYQLAADHGYAPAQYNLGLLLEDGRGVPKDAGAAARLYRAAAEQGFAPAQIYYGLALSEGKQGLVRDPVQAFVWLSRAVQNGAKSDARDALAKALTSEQLSAATRQLGNGRAADPAPALPAASFPDNASAKLVDQLREQSRRLAARVEALTTEKEGTDRQAVILAAQVKDLQQELQQTKATAPAADTSRYQGEITTLTAKLEQAAGSLRQLQQANTQLNAANQTLQQDNASLAAAAAKPGAEPGKASAPDTPQQASVIANLQRDNSRLNDEVKRATRELLSLNQQVRALRNHPSKPAAPDLPAAAPPVQPPPATEQLQQQLATLQREFGGTRPNWKSGPHRWRRPSTKNPPPRPCWSQRPRN